MFYVGIDGGGGSTRFAIINEDNEVIGQLTLEKGINYHLYGIESVYETIKEGINKLLEKVDVNLKDVKGIGASVSGVDSSRPKDVEIFKNIFSKIANFEKMAISNDAIGALWGATEDGNGIILINGTGSIIYGKNGDRIERFGGWGYLLDDEGGGYWIATEGVKKILHFRDGLIEKPSFYDEILKYFNIDDPSSFVYIYYQEFSKRRIAGAAKIVIDAASKGDKVAIEIIERGLRWCTKGIKLLAQRLDMIEKPTITYSGGLFKSQYYKTVFSNILFEAFEQFELIEPKHSAAVGAALMVLNESK
ncbi:MAG TPA: hypothetical protein ENF81_06740 [Thermotogaceae bacterium]|nr:hypothetical protein [Thermotogota bacterium]HEW92221.1 hypothetical protein [Thermotogaceae bacterium]